MLVRFVTTLTVGFLSVSIAPAVGQEFQLQKLELLDTAAAGILAAAREDGTFVTLSVSTRVTPAQAAAGARSVQHEIVFVEPVHGWDVAALPDGRWFVLAGGVERGLDVYLFDPRTGEVGLPFRTDGGLRLPTTFGEGGSVPRADSVHVVAFAVERAERCVVHVVDFSHQVPRELASLDGPLEARDFAIRYAAETQLLAVELIGVEPAQSVEVLHPLAPKLVLDPQRVDFGLVQAGAPTSRRVTLRNVGSRTLALSMRMVGRAFRSTAVPFVTVEPGGEHAVDVLFAPLSLGESRGTLQILSPVAGASGDVTLTGEAVLSLSEPAASTPVVDPAAVEPETSSQSEPSVAATSADVVPVEPRPPLMSLRADELHELEARRIDADRVWVTGKLALDPVRFPALLFGSALKLVVHNHNTGDEGKADVASYDAMIDTVVRARAGDALEIVLRDEREPTPASVAFALIQPWLGLDRENGRTCEVRVAPSGHYLLMLVQPDETGERPARVFRSWRGQADGRGVGRVPLDSIPLRRDGPSYLVVAEVGSDESGLVCSGVLEVR